MEDSETLFSNKASYNTNIKLTHKDEIIQNDKKLAATLNSFFKNAVSNLNLNKNSFGINKEHKNIKYTIEKIIVKYQFHPTILIIKNRIKNNSTFRFKHVMLSDIKNEIKDLYPNEATTHNNIPPKILRESAEVTSNSYSLITQYQTVSFLKI